jgi:hypothetical protein
VARRSIRHLVLACRLVVSDKELAAVNIARADFHGEWNYTIKPSNRSNGAVDP